MKLLNQKVEPLEFELLVSTLLEGSLVTSVVIRNYPIVIGDCEFSVDLILLDMKGMDVILGMDWLVGNFVTLGCYGKKIIFQQPRQSKFVFYCSYAVIPIR